ATMIFIAAVIIKPSKGSELIKACGDRLETIMNSICSYREQKLPCYDFESAQSAVIVSKCCNVGCRKNEIENVCCFTEKCLQNCYQNKDM
ncbi:hypothetical protein Tcan_01279, partial [Toxocara canis]